MNRPPTEPNEHDAIRLWLPSEAPLPASLWPRLAAAQQRRRRRLHGSIAATGAITAVVLGFSLMQGGMELPQTAVPPAAALATLEFVSPELSAGDILLVDQALQSAYETGASDDDVAPLWELRQRIVSANSAPTSI